MKKINSIWFGSRILAVGGVFTVIIPLSLYLLNLWIMNVTFMIIAKVSMAVGILILLLFTVLLVVELKQDKKINMQYNKLKFQKIQISDDDYECQYCGSMNVKKEDSFCRICGVKFKQ